MIVEVGLAVLLFSWCCRNWRPAAAFLHVCVAHNYFRPPSALWCRGNSLPMTGANDRRSMPMTGPEPKMPVIGIGRRSLAMAFAWRS